MQDVYARTLTRAAEIVGGQRKLAFRLKVAPSRLTLWIAGLEQAPAHIFLQAVDVVLDRKIESQRREKAKIR
jgi:DNA-binding transcriptional regulator YdaS (Cro superfamily)